MISESDRFGKPLAQAARVLPLPDIVPGLREHTWPNPWVPTQATLLKQPGMISGQSPKLPQPGERRRLVE